MMVDWSTMDESNQTMDDVVDNEALNALLMKYGCMKEIVVFRKRKIVHVYDIIEHGRRHYRSLVFSSDNRYCLRDIASYIPREAEMPITVSYKVLLGSMFISVYTTGRKQIITITSTNIIIIYYKNEF